mmetsp:Transcript_103963/g.335092  ORF Transcript_103963/g.335092 Transcript_103963/m.335092 type:complete len:311 (+) Transcript_103963:714-1646(+)
MRARRQHDRQLSLGRDVTEKHRGPGVSRGLPAQEQASGGSHLFSPRCQHGSGYLHDHNSRTLLRHGEDQLIGLPIKTIRWPVHVLDGRGAGDDDHNIRLQRQALRRRQVVARARQDLDVGIPGPAGDGVQGSHDGGREDVTRATARVVVTARQALVTRHLNAQANGTGGRNLADNGDCPHTVCLKGQNSVVLQQNHRGHGNISREHAVCGIGNISVQIIGATSRVNTSRVLVKAQSVRGRQCALDCPVQQRCVCRQAQRLSVEETVHASRLVHVETLAQARAMGGTPIGHHEALEAHAPVQNVKLLLVRA